MKRWRCNFWALTEHLFYLIDGKPTSTPPGIQMVEETNRDDELPIPEFLELQFIRSPHYPFFTVASSMLTFVGELPSDHEEVEAEELDVSQEMS